MLLVDDLDQLLDVLTALQFVPALDGDNLALVGSGGGVAVVGSDRADRWNLQMAPFAESTRERLTPFEAPGTSLSNPIDIPIWSLFDETGSFTGSIVSAVADRRLDRRDLRVPRSRHRVRHAGHRSPETSWCGR